MTYDEAKELILSRAAKMKGVTVDPEAIERGIASLMGQKRLLVAVKRSHRGQEPDGWQHLVSELDGVTAATNADIMVIFATDEVADQLRTRFEYLHVEIDIPHKFI